MELTDPSPERTFTLKQLRDAGRDTGFSDAVEEVIAVLNPPPAHQPAASTGNPIPATSPFPSSEKRDADFDVPQVTKTQDDVAVVEEMLKAAQERIDSWVVRHLGL